MDRMIHAASRGHSVMCTVSMSISTQLDNKIIVIRRARRSCGICKPISHKG